MMVMNRQVNLPAMQRVMMEFEKQSEFMDMKQEVMDETIDDSMAEEGEEEEQDAVELFFVVVVVFLLLFCSLFK